MANVIKKPWTVPEEEGGKEKSPPVPDFVTELGDYLNFSRDVTGFLNVLRGVQTERGTYTRYQFVEKLRKKLNERREGNEPEKKKAKLTCSQQQSEEEEEEEEEEERQSSSSAEPEEEDAASPEPVASVPELPGQKEAEAEELRLTALESQCDPGTSEVSSST